MPSNGKSKATSKPTGKRKPTAKASDKPPSKAQTMSTLAADTGLTKSQVVSVFDSLSALIESSLRLHGQYTIPGLAKVTLKHKPATAARRGINPFTKEPMTFKAKPASKAVKVRPLKGLKDMAL